MLRTISLFLVFPSLLQCVCKLPEHLLVIHNLTLPVVENEVEQLLPGDWVFVYTYVVNIAVLLEGGDL